MSSESLELCREKALRLLENSPHSVRGLKQKLFNAGKFTTQDIQTVIDDLLKAGLLDDAMFAANYIDYLKTTGIGRFKAIFKLKSKGVESVRQHIALLKDYVNLGLGEVISSIRQHLCDGDLTLNTTDITAIEAIEQEYLTDEFIYGRNPGYTVVRRGRIEGAGEFEIRMDVKNNRLQSMNILGDYFQTGDIDAGIIRRLKGTEMTPEAFDNALPSRLDDLILHLEKEPFINLIFNLQQYGKQKNLSL